MKKLILVTAVVAALSFPVGAFGATFTGVVVGKTGSSLAVASKSGTVRTVQTRSHARVGARVRVNGAAVRVVARATETPLGERRHARPRSSPSRGAGAGTRGTGARAGRG